ncbi:MAG: carboxypeptidase-like regulatory domain-containing protein, partial [Muribaculaceae bacterium]|nr:carboxypeptidase-like regulatory domain-containing protein [Muribaculaceae bacterium]
DLLMMVNGWSRYNLPEAILGRYGEPELPLEIGQEITGQVRSRWKGKPMKGVLMSVIVPEYNFGTFAETDSKGNFRINGFDLPEGASFIFRAMNAKGGNEGNYYIDKDSLPSVDILREKPAEASAVEASEYFKAMRWVMLDEVKVQAFNYGDDDFNVLRSLASYSNDSENMALRGITSLEQAVRFIPGMTLRNGMLMYRNKYVGIYIDGDMFTIPGDTPSGGGILKQGVFSPHNPLPRTYHRSRFASSSQASQNNAPMVMVDDTPSPSIQASSTLKLSDVANAVSFQDIDRIDYIRAENFVIGPSPMGGALMITTKTGANKSSGKQFELKDYLPLGYQKHKEYSSPILSVDADDYDLQTQPTLMWIPSVKFDEAGETIC